MPRRALLGIVLPALFVGCSAAVSPAPSSTSPSGAASVPGSSPLSAFGITHGPENLWLPSSLMPASRIDQPNVVTLFLDDSVGQQTAGWLEQHLPAMGWTIDAAKNGSILFHDAHWRGAFTTPTPGEKATLAGLTLRRASA